MKIQKKDKPGKGDDGLTVIENSVSQNQLSEPVQGLIESSPDPSITIGIEGKIIDMNEALVNITGMERKKIIGSDFFKYFTEPEKAREVYQEVFAKGSVPDSPLTLRHKDGKLTDVLFNGSVYKNKTGKILGIAIVAKVVTEQKWAIELRIANKELAFQNDEKEKRAAELYIANKELAFQNDEKEKRAEELIIANKELLFQNDEKEKRAAELVVANKELAFQNDEKEKRAAELDIANKELAFQNDEKEKRAAELVIANKELAFQNDEKEKRAAELVIANKELAFQNEVKEKRAAELIIANEELAFQNDEKEKRAAELGIANKELAFQNQVKEKRAAELVIANEELAFQNDEKEKRAAELVIANKELIFQTGEKEKRAAELVIADIELDFQNKEKEKRAIANKELEAFSYSVKLASQYSLSLIEASLDPLVTISTEGKITDMNEALVNITGMTREKLTGTDFFYYFTEPQKAREVYQEVFAKGSVADSPLTLRHKDGKLTDVLFNGSVYKDDQGNVLGVVIVARDVTAQKLLSKYSLSLIEASLDPLVTISTEGKITDMNEALVNITGIEREKLIGSDFFDYFTEPQKAREVYQVVFAKGSVADSPLTLRHKDGKLTDVLFNGSVYKDDRGNVLGVVIVARDVTAQKLLSKYSLSLIEASLDPLFTISTEGKITDMNQATVNITGIEREKLIGTDFFGYFTEPQKAREVYQEVYAKGSVADSPLTLRHKDSKLTDVLFNGSVYKDDRGNVLGAVVVARDTTTQKQLAERVIAGREKELMRIEELERFRKLTVGRELKMIELKKEIEELKSQISNRS